MLGESYVPLTGDLPLVERGLASWYGRKFHGRRTASGEVYNMHAMTAAHKTMPIPSYARVRNPANGREIIVRVNDRGPFAAGRVIDLSYAAAVKLGVQNGVAPVELERITHDDIRAGRWDRRRPPSSPLRLPWPRRNPHFHLGRPRVRTLRRPAASGCNSVRSARAPAPTPSSSG